MEDWNKMGIIEVTELKKYYGKNPNIVKAVDGISLTIEEGFTAVTGASGCGKSTFLQLIGGLRRPSEGSVSINKTDLSVFDEEELAIFRRRNLGFIFKQYNLIPVLNVYENIIFPIELEGRVVDTEYILQITKLLNIEDKLYCYPKVLSNSERQKVSIARALSTKPAVVLADEPAGNMDYRAGAEIVGLLKLTCKAFNQTVVLGTGNRDIAAMAEQVIHLKDGKVERIEKRREFHEAAN